MSEVPVAAAVPIEVAGEAAAEVDAVPAAPALSQGFGGAGMADGCEM